MQTLTHGELLDLMNYDDSTGIFRWKVKANRNSTCGGVGRRAGCINNQGYRVIQIDGRQYQSARLAWFYIHGYWPNEVDHKNCNRSDDRIANLRNASRQQNNHNRQVFPKNKCGTKGVRAKGSKWEANIWLNKKSVYLGTFDSLELAGTAYADAANKYFGEFARVA